MMSKENNVGSAALVGTLVAGEAGAIKLPGTPKNRNGLGAGLLKDIRPDKWQTKAVIARGNFTV